VLAVELRFVGFAGKNRRRTEDAAAALGMLDPELDEFMSAHAIMVQ
jgi:hypothetical protein